MSFVIALVFCQDLDRDIRLIVDEELTLVRHDVRLMVAEALEADKAPLDRALSHINAGALGNLMRFYAGDDLGGRAAGTDNERVATDFIARQFAAAGFKPVGDGGSYFQAFEFEGGASRNVAALLEGGDLKDEIVVIGAHHDHVGSKADGHRGQRGASSRDDEIWNGADDNGSGSTAVMTIARAFGAAGLKPRRSILFMTFGAEEWGLLGSRHYTNAPIFKNHVAMINMDMIGRNPDKPVEVYGLGGADIFPGLLDGAIGRTGLAVDRNDDVIIKGGGASDHQSFYDKKIPALFFFTGFHANYHQVTDSPEKIDHPHQATVARTAALILWELANRDEAPVFVGRSTSPRGRKLGVKLGDVAAADLDDLGLAETEGGLLITEVTDGEAAAKAGLKKDDILVSFDGHPFPRERAADALKRALGSARAGASEVEILRGGKRLKVTIAW